MFNFGSVEDNVALFKDAALRFDGPKVPDVPVNELTKKQLPIKLTYARIAYYKAIEEGASAEVVDALKVEHDEIFVRLAELSPEFRDVVRRNIHRPLTEFSDPDSQKKYMEMAGVL